MSKDPNFILSREHGTIGFTFGLMSYLGSNVCYILEDQERQEKIPGKTAIPLGDYQIDISISPKFKILLPILLLVPNFTGIRIHTGYDADDTEGCLITGKIPDRKSGTIKNSAIAFNELFPLIELDIKRNKESWLRII